MDLGIFTFSDYQCQKTCKNMFLENNSLFPSQHSECNLFKVYRKKAFFLELCFLHVLWNKRCLEGSIDFIILDTIPLLLPPQWIL